MTNKITKRDHVAMTLPNLTTEAKVQIIEADLGSLKT